MKRVIASMLVQVDGSSGAPDEHVLFLFGASSDPDFIDPATLRPRRFDMYIVVGPSGRADRKHINEANPFFGSSAMRTMNMLELWKNVIAIQE